MFKAINDIHSIKDLNTIKDPIQTDNRPKLVQAVFTFCKMNVLIFSSLLSIKFSLGWWLLGRWVSGLMVRGLVGRWSVGKWLVKTHLCDMTEAK